jgi:septum formation inhibitor MinC
MDPVDVATRFLKIGSADGLHPSQSATDALRQILKEHSMQSIDVVNATSAQLLDFYNANAPKPVKRFADRATAEKRCQAIIDAATKPVPDKPKAVEQDKPKAKAPVKETKTKAKAPTKTKAKAQADKPATTRAQGVGESWKDPKVAAARSVKNKVRVGGQVYNSTWAAFQALKLDPSKHLKFRAHLKAQKVATFEGHKFTLVETGA